MWSAQLNRREFFEFYLGSTKIVEGRVRSSSQINLGKGNELTFIWEHNPLDRFALPSLVIMPDEEVEKLLAMVLAAPQAPSPITSLSRVLGHKDAREYFEEDLLPTNEAVLSAFAALSLVESLLHSDGRIGIRQLTPMLCKRTLAFTWGKAVAASGTPNSFNELPKRWLDVYSALNPAEVSSAAHRNVKSFLSVLSVVTQLAAGVRPNSLGGALAFELLSGGKRSREEAWRAVAGCLDIQIEIDALLALTREERGSYLQKALRTLSSLPSLVSDDQVDLIAACAFLATQLAPGSLDHLQVLQSAAKPEMLSWYVLYATLQTPKEILSMQGGLGFRVVRDMLRVEDRLAPPSADISFAEFKLLNRSGVDSIVSKLGHASELQVELVPYVSGTFTFQSRNRSRWEDEPQLPVTEPVVEAKQSPRERLVLLAAELAQLAQEVAEPESTAQISPRRQRRKPG